MANELSTLDLNNLPSTQTGGDAFFDECAKGDFIAPMKLYTRGAVIDEGLIPPGHYGSPVSKDEILGLGNKIDVLLLARTPFALDMSDRDAIIRNYDPESDEFQRIVQMSTVKDSACQYGPRFLVFERNTQRFFDYFCGSKSSRREAKNFYAFLPVTPADIKARGLDAEPRGPIPATLSVKVARKGNWSWHVPQIKKCPTPLEVPADEAVKRIKQFLAVEGDDVEKVDNTDRRAR